MRFALGLAAVLPLLSLVPACATNGADDDLAGEADDSLSDGGKADGTSVGVSTYFAIHTATGGKFKLERLNASTTTCHDGVKRSSCKVPELDWSETADTLSLDQRTALTDAAARTGGVYAIVRGRFNKKALTTTPSTAGRFIVTEAWVAKGDGVADGVFAKVKDNGIRCITAPCPSQTEYALNASRQANIVNVDFSAGDISSDAEQELTSDFSTTGYIIAGDRYYLGSSNKARTATNAYRNLANEHSDAACVVSGCSGEICADEGMVSSCIYKPQYACYHQPSIATCERQTNGKCGWTQSDELLACLGDPPDPN
ncbi:MAG TPA: DUF6748 domain-containing protein [Kofleriaceae bacterium]|jgi:hypothetical protein